MRNVPSLLERRWNRHMARLLEMEVPSKINGDQTHRHRMLPSPPLTESTPEEDRIQGPHSASPVTLHHPHHHQLGEAIPFGTHMNNMDLPFLDPQVSFGCFHESVHGLINYRLHTPFAPFHRQFGVQWVFRVPVRRKLFRGG
jgi:hypothetical protein